MTPEIDRREFLIATTAVGGRNGAVPLSPGCVRRGRNRWRSGQLPALAIALGMAASKSIRGSSSVPTTASSFASTSRNWVRVCDLELDDDLRGNWSATGRRCNPVYADPNRHIRQNNVYDHLHTEASSSVRLGRVLYQQAGASARERLKAVAAQEWGVSVAEIATKDGVLTHRPTGRTLRYGEVAAKAAAIKLDKEPAIKTPDRYTFDRHPREALRCRGEVARPSRLRHRYAPIWDGLRGDETIAHLWRLAQELRLRIDPEPARRHRRGADGRHRLGQRHRGRRRHMVARQDCARCVCRWRGIRDRTSTRAPATSSNQYPRHARSERPDACRRRRRRGGAPRRDEIVEAEYQPHQGDAQMEPPNCTAQSDADGAEGLDWYADSGLRHAHDGKAHRTAL